MNVFARFMFAGLCFLAATAGQPSMALSPWSMLAVSHTTITSPVFVLNSLDDSVSVIDPTSRTGTRSMDTGKQPHHLYLTPDEKSIIVANALSDSGVSGFGSVRGFTGCTTA